MHHKSLAQDVLTEIDQTIGIYNSVEDVVGSGRAEEIWNEIRCYTETCFPEASLEDARKVRSSFVKLINTRS